MNSTLDANTSPGDRQRHTDPAPHGAGRPHVGVLAYQGDVREHQQVLEGLGANVSLVRTTAQLEQVDGLVIPGGESSVIDKLSRVFGTDRAIRERIADGMPVFGTCAGMIMLADTVLDAAPGQRSFGGLDIDVRRNVFGSQIDSFEADLDVPVFGTAPVHAVFIRAPGVERVGRGVKVLASINGRAVAVESAAILATAFHPEVTSEVRFHERFLANIRQ